LVEAVTTHGLLLLLLDVRRSGALLPADQDWTEGELMPRLMEVGIQRTAILGGPKGEGLFNVGKDEARSGLAGSVIAHFDNLSMAMLWLLDNAGTDEAFRHERQRLEALHAYGVLDTAAQASYDDITRIAAQITGSPIALISLVDRDRQWFKSKVGLATDQTARHISICSHAIQTPDQVFVVPDATRDARFAASPLVTGDPFVRFYAGAPLVNPDGFAVGTLCVIDERPRVLDEAQLEALKALARLVVMQLEFRKLALELRTTQADIDRCLGRLRGDQLHLDRIATRQVHALLDGTLDADRTSRPGELDDLGPGDTRTSVRLNGQVEA
jgi:GAF domain-containing protein